MFACRTRGLHLWTGLCAAAFHGGDRLQMLAGQFVVILHAQIRFERFNERSQPHHLTFPQVMRKPFIKSLMRAIA